MDVFEGPYYRINKLLLTCLGQWPYQNPLQRRIIRTALLIFVVSVIWPEIDDFKGSIIKSMEDQIPVTWILHMIAVWGDLDYVIESGSAFGVELTTIIKISNYVFNARKVKMLLNRIRDDWNFNIFGSRLIILKKYGDESRKVVTILSLSKYIVSYTGQIIQTFYTCANTMRTRASGLLVAGIGCFESNVSGSFDGDQLSVYMYSTLLGYVMLPLIPKFFGLAMAQNESSPAIPFPIKYGNLDTNKYYFPMMIHSDCAAALIITTIVAMDTTYAVYVQHACAIFTVIGDRLEHLIEAHNYDQLDDPSAKEQEEETYQEIVNCAKLHSEALDFANAIESTHVVVFFLVTALSVVCMSAAGYQTLMNLNKPNEAVRFATFTIAQVAHIFFLSWPGQRLIDHSERIHEQVYGARWFQTSARAKKLLMIMMLRSVKPCSVTAGKLYVMSFSNFSMIIRTSMSYFTVLTSFMND